MSLRFFDSRLECEHLFLLCWVFLELLAESGFDALTSTSGTSDSMDVGLRVLGKVVVEDNVDRGDIQTTGGDIGSNQDIS
ncbi:hypothetical protein HG530_001138 [Fusarium avenaceum]|nr:hypothetical protein HG530_001138 [Fusarium avenaceum]